MFFSAADVQRFPFCVEAMKRFATPHWLKAHRKKVWEAYVDHCQDGMDVQTATDRFARQALTWTQPPLVGLVQGMIHRQIPSMAGQSTAGVQRRCAETASLLGVIGTNIWENVFWTFEASKDWTALQHNWERLEATLLHEMIHWARFAAGLREDEEMGDSFERRAYNKLRCSSLEIGRANALAQTTSTRPPVGDRRTWAPVSIP